MTYKPTPVKRKLERNGKCRLCYKPLTKHEDEVVSWHSSCGRGMHIILCLDCCDELGNIANLEEEGDEERTDR